MASVLVIGSGGREHAISWALSKSENVEKVFTAPGNAGTSFVGENVSIDAGNFSSVFHFVKSKGVDLVVVGPEKPLVEGIVDYLEERGVKVFGPCKAAARLEGSKEFAKRVMLDARVPTASFKSFSSSQSGEARSYVEELGGRVVVKADGLAAGKGVIVCSSRQEALDAIDRVAVKKEFGVAGETFLVEELLEGVEASVLALVDGKRVVPLAPAQDHKRVFDNDEGPNTGGMGAYSPTPFVSRQALEEIREEVLEPVVKTLSSQGITYKGVLYAGLMLTKKGPKVLEFNARFGDPETQAILPLLESDFFELCNSVSQGSLRASQASWKEGAACCVVLSSKGYPGGYATGVEVRGLKEAESVNGVNVFHSGTALENGKVVTSGGRVLGVTGSGESIGDAIAVAYSGVSRIHFEGMHYRKDIGLKAL
ncbi:MAG TPA: phosphoribosylamine--glycine ligase, partial [archaeon]|nr:phosphoribosylamine--glycine ligase [archaeon]